MNINLPDHLQLNFYLLDLPELEARRLELSFKGLGKNVRVYNEIEPHFSDIKDCQIFFLSGHDRDVISKLKEINKLQGVKSGMGWIFILDEGTGNVDSIELYRKGADYVLQFGDSRHEITMAKVFNVLQRFSLIEGPYTFLHEACAIKYGKVIIRFTAANFKVLSFMFSRLNQCVLREELMRELFEEGMTYRNIDIHVHMLKKQVMPLDLCFKSVYGEGYILSMVRKPEGEIKNETNLKYRI